MSKYILLTKIDGETVAVNHETILALVSTPSYGDANTAKTEIQMKGYTVSVKEPIAIVIEKLNTMETQNYANRRC